MFNILSQTTLKVKFLRNEEQHCLLPSLVDDFTCVHSKNALLTHILSALFSSTSVLFSCTPFGTKSYIIICMQKDYIHTHVKGSVVHVRVWWIMETKIITQHALKLVTVSVFIMLKLGIKGKKVLI